MNLSKHFALNEATKSYTAAKQGIDNQPDDSQLNGLKRSAHGMENVRNLLGGSPITPSSWLRVEELNELVGGSETSHHIKGYAVDFTCPDFGTPVEIVKAIEQSCIVFDQLILERVGGKEWVHISFAPAQRMQVFEIKD